MTVLYYLTGIILCRSCFPFFQVVDFKTDICFLQAKGAGIGDVYIATEFANHDRRIPIPVRLDNELLDEIDIVYCSLLQTLSLVSISGHG